MEVLDDDMLDLVTSYEYDSNNLVTKIISPSGVIIENEY
jgi:hypothetical protein